MSEVNFTLPTKLKTIEATVIQKTLEIKGGNRTHTARELGIGIRTLQRKLKKLGLSDYLLNTAASTTATEAAPAESTEVKPTEAAA